jgi:Protein of unknown function (DUF3108)
MRSAWFFRFARFLALALVCGSALGGARAARKAKARGAATPFRAGEQLDYQISWSHFTIAATAEMAAVGLGPFYGSPAWHFRATATSVGALRYLMPFNDQFDSYAEAATLSSRQYEIYIHEEGKQATRVVRMTDGHERRRADGPMTVVLPGTRDPLAAAYFLRTVDWQEQTEVSCPVYDGSKLYDLEARLEDANARVTVAAGSFYAWQVGVRVTERGKAASSLMLTVWIAHDPAHTPVLAEGTLPIGSVRAELVRALR